MQSGRHYQKHHCSTALRDPSHGNESEGDRKKAAGIAPDSWTYVLVDWQGHLLLGNIETNAHTAESIIHIATKQPNSTIQKIHLQLLIVPPYLVLFEST
jgi:hypothetical protein